MDFTFVKEIAANTRRLACVLLYACCAQASAANAQQASANLPDLPGANDADSGHFGLDGQSVELGYATRQRKWGARLDEYTDLDRSVTLDYGTLLTDELGAGAALRHRNAYSDLWINGVYAPARDVRLRLAGGQLRANDDAVEAGGTPNAVEQNSYLLGARRSWRNGLLTGVGVTAYAVEANDAGAAAMASASHADGLGAEATDTEQLASGRQQGHALNLSLRPTTRSKIDLSREHNRLTYYSTDGSRATRELAANRVNFSQYFDNCVRLQGGYSTNAESNRLDLSVGRERWHVSVSRVQAVDGGDTAVGIGYTVPLGRSPNGAGKCALQPAAPGAFEPVIDATVNRPEQFPLDPLTAAGALE